MVLPVMHGGGAERVATLLLNEFQRQGHHCECLLTNDTPIKVTRNNLSSNIQLMFLQDLRVTRPSNISIFLPILRLYSSAFCRLFELFRKTVPAHFAYLSFIAQYHDEIQKLHDYLISQPQTTVIVFLQPSIPLIMLAARGVPNKVIFSERGDAKRLMQHRYGKLFIKKYYERANLAVFQTDEAKNSYPANISAKGHIIINPVKKNLPSPFIGKRRKVINTFCRISKQKNLPFLLEAFQLLHEKHPDYQLHIIGDALNQEGESVMAQMKQFIASSHLDDVVSFKPFTHFVHQEIIEDAMYVNSSDYEGISNAMLEAMAIGLPTICTDCPIGGARTIIHDHENGLLIPVRDVQALANAMTEVIENPFLMKKLSDNGSKIRYELNVEKIARSWLELL